MRNTMNYYAMKKNLPIRNCTEFDGKFETIPMDEDWKESIKSRVWAKNYTGPQKLNADYAKLRDILLGWAICCGLIWVSALSMASRLPRRSVCIWAHPL